MDDEYDITHSKEHDYATRDESSPYDAILPEQPVPLKVRPKRLTFRRREGERYDIFLVKRNVYHEALFQAFATSLQSNWFNSLSDSSQSAYQSIIHNFIHWINETSYQTTSINRYECL